MNIKRCSVLNACLLALAACGGSSPTPQVSKGLKIFATSRTHVADFKNDPYLHGDTAIAKADDFCNTDPNRPDALTYRALLVDGVTRDAKVRMDWVLQPSTTYYRPYDDVPVGTTTAAAIFGATYAPLTNPIDAGAGTQVWTGIANSADFAAGDCCNGWSDLTNTYSAKYGFSSDKDGNAFSAVGGGMGCAYFQLEVYCVQQP